LGPDELPNALDVVEDEQRVGGRAGKGAEADFLYPEELFVIYFHIFELSISSKLV
jgi:hypothetical protein